MVRNVIIFGAGRSSSVHVHNINKDILILGEGPRIMEETVSYLLIQ